MRPPPVIGISLGDVAGIGPEVTLKALASRNISREFVYLIIGDRTVLETTAKRLKIKRAMKTWQPGFPLARDGSVFVYQPNPSTLPRMPLGRLNVSSARAAYEWLGVGVRLCLRKECAALVTAPVNKEAINRAGINFQGATELLAQLTKTKTFAMMLASRALKVALATNHIALRDVGASLTSQRVRDVVRLTHNTLRRMGVAHPRIAVAGLNPHAGEGGLFGDEEKQKILPAVKAMRRARMTVTGPISGDAVFYRAYHGEFDAVVAMYHDQGLAPMKLVAFDEAVNLTMGLPIIRTSPDHGTAYDIAGKGIARPDSMIAAINLAAQLAGRWASAR